MVGGQLEALFVRARSGERDAAWVLVYELARLETLGLDVDAGAVLVHSVRGQVLADWMSVEIRQARTRSVAHARGYVRRVVRRLDSERMRVVAREVGNVADG